MKAARTKAVGISPSVKRKVWARDKERCIFCQSPYAAPEAHYIPGGAKGALAQNRIFSQRAGGAIEDLTKEQKNNGNR